VRAEKAFLASLVTNGRRSQEGDPLAEIRRLASDAGAVVVGAAAQTRARPDPATYIGKGKALEIRDVAGAKNADLVILDNDLSAAQVRNLENLIRLKVVDRTELILDIFASRARTHQARLQVELAQLEYSLPRLKRMWTHLSRIEGGIGMRGPGEKQLESDRRAANRRIRDLKKKLEKIRARRSRAASARQSVFKISLVGYTNAGKSTLMNRLTRAGVTVRDRLFETLDTRTRAWKLPGGHRALLSDTVGFIQRLPHHLVESFHATLEETRQADLLLHVVDASAPDAADQMIAVQNVLKDIGAHRIPDLAVFNKIDLAADRLKVADLSGRVPHHAIVSASTGEGIDDLTEKTADILEKQMVEVDLDLPPDSGPVEAAVKRAGRVLSVEYGEHGGRMKALLRRDDVEGIRKLAQSSRPGST